MPKSSSCCLIFELLFTTTSGNNIFGLPRFKAWGAECGVVEQPDSVFPSDVLTEGIQTANLADDTADAEVGRAHGRHPEGLGLGVGQVALELVELFLFAGALLHVAGKGGGVDTGSHGGKARLCERGPFEAPFFFGFFFPLAWCQSVASSSMRMYFWACSRSSE